MKPIKENKQSGRKTGIDVLGEMPWGTHIGLFYQTKKDLIDILVPYFKAGLENNEFCMWITYKTITVQSAKNALRKAVPDFDKYFKRGQIKIVPHTDWYLKNGVFNSQRILKLWTNRLNQALTEGYSGIRVSGNMGWLNRRIWKDFIGYENNINETIGRYRMIAICGYFIDKCETSEIIEVAGSHQFALVRRDGKWELIKNMERKRTEKRLLDYQTHLRSLATELSLAEESQKQRIAAELHKQIIQSLAVSKMELEMLGKSISSGQPQKTLDKICCSLGHAIEDIRLLSLELGSAVLHELGFEAAVSEWLDEQIRRKHRLATEFEDDGQTKHLDKDIRAVLFRDVRELLLNVVKHSHAHKVKVSIRKVGSQICVCVEDNGIGFEPEKIAAIQGKKGGFGLFGIQERLKELGGHIEIDSKANSGAKITIMAPLTKEKTNIAKKRLRKNSKTKNYEL
jgi:signal transduction histidine kinase